MSFIYQVENYYSDGQHIREYICVSGEKPEGMSKFVGLGMVELEMPDGRRIPKQFSADINAETIQEAFEKMPTIMEESLPAAAEDFKKELKEISESEKSRRESQSNIIIPQ